MTLFAGLCGFCSAIRKAERISAIRTHQFGLFQRQTFLIFRT